MNILKPVIGIGSKNKINIGTMKVKLATKTGACSLRTINMALTNTKCEENINTPNS